MVLGREQSDVSFQVTINTPIHQSANQYPQCLEPTCQSCGRQQPSNKCHRLRSLLRHLELRSRQRRHRILEHQILLQQLATNHRSKLQFLRLPCVQLQPHRPFMDPLLDPTPNHQDYLSTHATFGGAAGAVISLWNGGNDIDVQLSSNVTHIQQVITRRTTSIKQAVKDNGDSRIFGGIHFQYASDVGAEIGWWVGEETWDAFDEGWEKF
jgi:hypothetical protein